MNLPTGQRMDIQLLSELILSSSRQSTVHLLQLCTCNGLQTFIAETVLKAGCVAVPVHLLHS